MLLKFYDGSNGKLTVAQHFYQQNDYFFSILFRLTLNMIDKFCDNDYKEKYVHLQKSI